VAVPGGALEVLDLPGPADEPALVLLHEGLGSVGLWRDFPERLHAATGRRVVAFSRFGHGRSSPPPRPRTPTFMHEEAREVLPPLFAALAIERPVLVGHSDGASIALIHAAEHPVSALAVLAPHVFVEEICVTAIAETRERFRAGELAGRMARHHDDPEVTFFGWAGVWLDPEFRAWDLVPLVSRIEAPLLVVQGDADEYGSLAQVDAIEGAASGPVERLVVHGGHWPHVDHPDEVVDAIRRLAGSAPARAA
jgi:pimeloyl-ACP methyl ester carboxylesterase